MGSLLFYERSLMSVTPFSDPDEYLKKAKYVVKEYINKGPVLESHPETITVDDLYIVWFTKTLQNWKSLVSTRFSDGLYYEVTYNGDKAETYLDVYAKINNVAVEDNDL